MKTNNTQYASPVMRHFFKFSILLVSIGVIFSSSVGLAQSSQAYLIYRNIDNIASFAHPSNTFIKGRSIIQDSGNFVDVTLVFEESTTKIRFVKNNNFFSSMSVVSNSEIWPAFATLNLMKSAIVVMIEKEMADNPQKYNDIHRFFLVNAKNMDYRQLTLFCLYVSALGD